MATKEKKITKACTRLCRYFFNDPEKLILGKELGEHNNALVSVEGDKKRIVADFSAKIAALESEVQSLSGKITSGYEHRDLPCTATFNDPKTGKKTVRRDDTKEVVGIEDMTESDLQTNLPLEGEPEA